MIIRKIGGHFIGTVRLISSHAVISPRESAGPIVDLNCKCNEGIFSEVVETP